MWFHEELERNHLSRAKSIISTSKSACGVSGAIPDAYYTLR